MPILEEASCQEHVEDTGNEAHEHHHDVRVVGKVFERAVEHILVYILLFARLEVVVYIIIFVCRIVREALCLAVAVGARVSSKLWQ